MHDPYADDIDSDESKYFKACSNLVSTQLALKTK